jgi:polyisoprenoid-binding protein YceI
MKRILLIALVPFLTSCFEPKNGNLAEVNDAQEVAKEDADTIVNIESDTANSAIQWSGASITDEHHGFINLKEGYFTLKNGELTGGKFVLDMNSIKAVMHEKEHDSEAALVKLSAHLKKADFFSTDSFPESVFEILGAKEIAGQDSVLLTGNLTIKDITKSISFPAVLVNQNGQLKASANFNIDRTLWGVTYRSDASFKNKMISPYINFHINLVSKNLVTAEQYE